MLRSHVMAFEGAELGPKGVRVHAIGSGPLATRAASGIPDFASLMERVAEAPAGAMTGDAIYIDGGSHILG